ncbi:CRISPR-associated protein Cas4 [Aneurinibacillus thermoaerophilus]|uniref:CRISPR-associated exonuclease Cas4 n=1 Tax=Aneurinibacillus thermoaerophilus TaxID=143495 RepID=A0A1G8CGM8_ANETH|nr:CRISPR-associated protein Cas4 [Aneurinibacillus thermoaerophilus]MED0674138.1 CRISPR-associated protein Cas4 [Aneurinibacillus thermoaerophilus]MED0680464.1 CRISPR-associated protein Cas4 [Aneurinibacillus thermoaerophilus]MED0758608.1 CRISPR-associated protein Cas4 [Aneurinibacillus thermoaerophilus]MED0761877.1 CRISPR-associated protein Cas4 [Aneurinibacillus thermoaerophilus]MED0766082.1 CRISPR-associated protein Cas4 [Aneurinibacillus thermoaerophilus]
MEVSEFSFHVSGTFIWYYTICKREVWLLSRQLNADQDFENIVLGRYLGEHYYGREKKELEVGNSKIDTYRWDGDQLVISEVKKSSTYRESAKLQLQFYLYELRQRGIDARGELRFPEEREKETVDLTDDDVERLERIIQEIQEIVSQPYPPVPRKLAVCKSCAYAEFCWS